MTTKSDGILDFPLGVFLRCFFGVGGGGGWWVATCGVSQKKHRVFFGENPEKLAGFVGLDGFDVVKCVENHCSQSRDNWKHAQCMYLLMKHIFERFPKRLRWKNTVAHWLKVK